MTCGATNTAAATYTGPPNTNFLVVHWKAPEVDVPKTYKFLFTVVQKETIFWVNNTAHSDIKVFPGNGVKASFW